MGEGCKRVESEMIENWRGHMGNSSPAAPLCFFYSHFRLLTEMDG